MRRKSSLTIKRYLLLIAMATCGVLIAWLLGNSFKVQALNNPQSGSIGLQGTINGPAPTVAAIITTPTNGQNFTKTPITVAGICQNGLLIKIFSNNVFVGSATCSNGSFSLQIDLFSGRNDLVARDFDNLDQAGPDSATVTVTFTSSQFVNLGPLLTLTSNYAKRGADPGQQLTWPIVLSGGTSPYALSINWGDGSAPDLLSEPFSGTITLTHTYQNAGSYIITIQATDKNGESGFLQLVGVANGPVGQANSTQGSGGKTQVINQVVWWPSLLALPLILTAFWLGRKYELLALRQQLEHSVHLLR